MILTLPPADLIMIERSSKEGWICLERQILHPINSEQGFALALATASPSSHLYFVRYSSSFNMYSDSSARNVEVLN